MRLADTSRRLRRPALYGLFAAGLIVYALTLTQCQLVQDSLTGVDLVKTKSVNNCLSDCRDQSKLAIKNENTRHQLAERACGDDQACLTREEARHEAALDAIHQQLQDCVNGCHQQGGGGSN